MNNLELNREFYCCDSESEMSKDPVKNHVKSELLHTSSSVSEFKYL